METPGLAAGAGFVVRELLVVSMERVLQRLCMQNILD